MELINKQWKVGVAMNSKNFIAGYNRGFEKAQKASDNRKSRLAKLRDKYQKQEQRDTSPKVLKSETKPQQNHQQVTAVRQLRKKLKESDKKLKATRQDFQSVQQENHQLKGRLNRLRSERSETDKQIKALNGEFEKTKNNLKQNYVHKSVIEDIQVKQQHQRQQIDDLKQANRNFHKKNHQLSDVNEETGKHLHVIREVLKNEHAAVDLLAEQKLNQQLEDEVNHLKEVVTKTDSNLQWYIRANNTLKHQYSRYKVKELNKMNSKALLKSINEDVLNRYITDHMTLNQAIDGLDRRLAPENMEEAAQRLEPVLNLLNDYFKHESVKYASELVRLDQYNEKREKKINFEKQLATKKQDQVVYSTKPRKKKAETDQAVANVNQELARKVLKGAKIIIIDWQTTYPITKALTRYGAEVMTFNDSNYHYNRLQTILNREDIDLIVINPNGMHHEVDLIIKDPNFKYQKRVLNLQRVKSSKRNAFDEVVWWLNGMRSRGER